MKKMLLLAGASVVALAGQAAAQTAEQRIARLEAELRKLRAEVTQQATVTKEVKATVAERPAYTPPVRAPYDWTGFTAGVVAGVGSSDKKTNYAYQPSTTANLGLGRNASGGIISPDYMTYGQNGMISNSTNGSASSSWDSLSTPGSVTQTPVPLQGNYSEATAPDLLANRNLNGGIGPQLGYQMQRGAFVFGFSADLVGQSKSKDNTFESRGAYTNSFGNLITAQANGDINNGCSTDSNVVNCSTGNTSINVTQSGSVASSTSGNASFSGSSSVTQHWLSTVRATAGFAQDRALVFATGGLAFGSVGMKYNAKYSDSMSGNCGGAGSSSSFSGAENGSVGASAEVSCDSGSYSSSAAASGTSTTTATWSKSHTGVRPGFAVGGGVAYAMSDNLILKVEGLYYNLGTASMLVNGLGSKTVTTNGGAPTNTNPAVTTVKVTERLDGVLARVGIAYKLP